MSDELKCCPVCGEKSEVYRELTSRPLVGCSNPKCWLYGVGFYLEAWQTRPREDAQQARIAELEGRTKDLSVLLDDPQSENALGAILLYIKRHFSPQKQESLARCLVADKYLETEARLAEYEAFHPRAMKLLHKRKNFLVVAEDEPFFFKVCNLIREHEKEIKCWADEDENWYQIERQKYLHRPLPQTQKGGEG
jgi:hypothetical protein